MTADVSPATHPTTNPSWAWAVPIPLLPETLDKSSAAVLAAALHELELYADTQEARAGSVLAAVLLDVQMCAPAVRQ
jgi:hypothetical protein